MLTLPLPELYSNPRARMLFVESVMVHEVRVLFVTVWDSVRPTNPLAGPPLSVYDLAVLS